MMCASIHPDPLGFTLSPARRTLYFDSNSWNPSQAPAQRTATPEASPLLPYPELSSPANGSPNLTGNEDRTRTQAQVLEPGQSKQSRWAASLKNLGTFETVEAFFATFKSLRRPSSLSAAPPAGTGSSSYYLFKHGIAPAWEDRANAHGGRWTFTLPLSNPALLDRSWTWLVLALIGEQLAPETVTQEEDDMDLVTGAAVTVRPGLHRLALWVSRFGSPDVARLNRLARTAVDAMDLASVPGMRVQFTPHAKPASWATDREAFWSLYTPVNTQAQSQASHVSNTDRSPVGPTRPVQAESWRSSRVGARAD